MCKFGFFILTLCTINPCHSQGVVTSPGSFVGVAAGEDPAVILARAASVRPSPRQVDWQEREFSLFVHFGMNTFTNREWGRKDEDPALFDPAQLDARQWVRVARDAGARQLVVVAKHHDGFCLWPSRWTDYSVKRSPWRGGKGDVIAEVSSACRESGLKMGIYLSPWDMASPMYGTDAYNEFFKNQLEELLTGYGEITEVWFDGANGEGANGKYQVYDWGGYYALIRRLQPGAVIAVMGPDVRWVGTESGYGRETEWSVIPLTAAEVGGKGLEFARPENVMQVDLGSRDRLRGARGLVWYPSEVDVSIRPGWFYHAAQDSQVKTSTQLVDIYYSSVGRNSHLLLNVPPDRRGLLAERDIRSLTGMRRILDSTFSVNVAATSRITCRPGGSGNPEAMIDDDPRTFWAASAGSIAPTLDFDLGGWRSFDRLLLQENFRTGQRVEEFVFEVEQSGGWREVTRGTTVGYKRLLRFPPISARHVRLRVLRSRGGPEISSFGLYLSAGGEH